MTTTVKRGPYPRPLSAEQRADLDQFIDAALDLDYPVAQITTLEEMWCVMFVPSIPERVRREQVTRSAQEIT